MVQGGEGAGASSAIIFSTLVQGGEGTSVVEHQTCKIVGLISSSSGRRTVQLLWQITRRAYSYFLRVWT